MATYIESDGGLSLGGNGTGYGYPYPYPPMYGYGFGGGGFGNGMFGGDGIWAILLFAMLFGNNGWGGGFGGGNNMLYDINANTNRGFDQAAVVGGINSLQNTVANGFANAEVSRCNAQTNLLQSMNSLGSAFQNCCCENRLATADLKYTIATENCEDRAVVANGIRDVIESNTRNTQLVLDKLCQQEIEAKNDLIATLRTQLNMANLAASQTAQTAELRAGQVAEVDALYNRLATCPVGTMPVYGNQPIFTCRNNNGCGCGCNGGVGVQ